MGFGVGVWCLGFGVEGLGFQVWGLVLGGSFGVWCLGFGVWVLGFWGSGFRVWGVGVGTFCSALFVFSKASAASLAFVSPSALASAGGPFALTLF